MNIEKTRFMRLCKEHGLTIFNSDDVQNALDFAWCLLVLEADALKKKEPHATNAIRRLEEAGDELYKLIDDAVELYEREDGSDA